MVTELAFAGLVGALTAQRFWELKKSAQNEAKMRAGGATEHAPEQITWMRLLHGGWLLCSIAEVILLERDFYWWLAVPAFLVLCAGQALRYLAMRELSWRWTVRVMTLPGRQPIEGGVYRYVRHPNYLGVILEIAALPLIHGAYITAIVFSALNGLLLWHRVRAEEIALDGASGNYMSKLGDKPRFVPRPSAIRR
jgi:methyltransferase